MSSEYPGAENTAEPNHEITQLLQQWQAGDNHAYRKLIPLIYENLRRIAGGVAASQHVAGQTQATAIVHELYLKMVDSSARNYTSRGHFFSAAARAMRQILIDRARREGAGKRGGDLQRVEWNESAAAKLSNNGQLVELHEALEDLAEKDPELASLVDLRHFAGLSVEEMAELLQVSTDTVRRRLRLAEAWLGSYLGKRES